MPTGSQAARAKKIEAKKAVPMAKACVLGSMALRSAASGDGAESRPGALTLTRDLAARNRSCEG